MRKEKEQYNEFRENCKIETGCTIHYNNYEDQERICKFCPHDKDRAGCPINRTEWTKLEPK